MKLLLSRKAEKALQETPSDMRRRLDSKISELFETPYPSGCRKLRGATNAYRLRIGDYRILYAVLSRDEILVFRIARREVAYE
ncbi:MAG: type II toxin-antitoxin system RelE family toxin [Candidatus Bathyarchaeia archaeon]